MQVVECYIGFITCLSQPLVLTVFHNQGFSKKTTPQHLYGRATSYARHFNVHLARNGGFREFHANFCSDMQSVEGQSNAENMEGFSPRCL
ncbi:unnamed protein product [Cylicocyclus nassatus]|uniref:Uncharacterized protein n=1 Tax=Cylicocyclus nassatus TaxID=53992 RepID=A0AA36M9M4_CYLNA|nr:unnamed protein product [Cylicocyclus nassatus]